MKVLYCLVEQKSIPPNYVVVYRILECQEVDTEDGEKFNIIYREYYQRMINEQHLCTMFFHLPTMDVRTLVDKKEASI